MDCVFCKIAAGEKPDEEIHYEDEHCIAFTAIPKQAPVHVLVIPKQHISNVMRLTADDAQRLYHIHKAIGEVAQKLGIAESGFRVITNNGPEGQQEVYHIHYHLIGGRQLKWEM